MTTTYNAEQINAARQIVRDGVGSIADTLTDIQICKLLNIVKAKPMASRYVMNDGYNVEFLGARPAKCGQDY